MKLNKEQQIAATTLEGSLLIIAVAGSGKTTVLINRAANLVEQGVDPNRILMFTFTKEAAANMKNRVMKLSDANCKNIYISTFHSFYRDMLRRFGGFIGMDTNFGLLTSQSDIEGSISDTIARCTKYGQLKGFPAISDISKAYSFSINSGKTLRNVIRYHFAKAEGFNEYEEEIIKLYSLWVEEKEKNATYTFDDLMIKMGQLMKDERGQKAVSSLYDYIMVDEYQDINKPQNDILLYLANDHRNIAVVGDDYQSIYAFRGSDVKYIERYECDNPDTTSVTVDTNYRSSNEIIKFVNDMMRRECHFGIKKDMKNTGITAGPVKVLHITDEEDEYQHILGELVLNKNKGVPYNEMAVLGRTSLRFTKLELLLTQNGIPYKLLGGTKFLDRSTIRDLIAIITCIVRPTNKTSRLSWRRVLKELVRGVGDKTASELIEDFETEDFLLLPKNQGSSFSEGIVSLNAALNRFRTNVDLDYMGTLQQMTAWYVEMRRELIRKSSRYKLESHRTEALNELNNELDAIDMFLEIANEYESLVEFLDGIAFGATVKDQSSEVTLSTVHSAKGLEWEHVYIIDVVDAVFPGRCSDDEEKEQLRLFYVALTRAKRELILYVPEYYKIKGFYTPVSISSFIRNTVSAGGDHILEKHISRYDILHHQNLDFEMIPDTLYGKNARSLLSDTEWNMVSKNVRRIGMCACCMQPTLPQNLDAHEVWKYDDRKHEQSLLDIIPVCGLCHDTNHIGNSVKSGRRTETELLEHFCNVNNVSMKSARAFLDTARETVAERNRFIWSQDEDSIKNVAKRYISEVCEINSNQKEIHWLRELPYYRKDAFKQWCSNHGVKYKWDAVEKRWGYYGPQNVELEELWNDC